MRYCDRCEIKPATKRHISTKFSYCDQCVFDLGLRNVTNLDPGSEYWDAVRRIRGT